MSPVISGKALRLQVESYIDEANPLISSALAFSRNSSAFRDIYKTSLAADTVWSALEDNRVKPEIAGVRSIILRIPLLVAASQMSVAAIELRRYLELTIWGIYFTHHPIEWQHFEGKRGQGFVRDQRKPIATAAHRDLNSYVEYAKEYMELEPSGLALKALSKLDGDKKLLNSATHAGEIARTPLSNLPIPMLTEKDLVKFAALHRRVLTHTVLLAAAFNREKFNVFPPEATAYWQWLLGVELQKKVRASAFGIFL